jgi:antitoxin MazE
MSKPAEQVIQKWGNSLAVRIPSTIARSAHFAVGQSVSVSTEGRAVILTPIINAELTLAQKLAAFDPAKHGGEALQTPPVGSEAI